MKYLENFSLCAAMGIMSLFYRAGIIMAQAPVIYGHSKATLPNYLTLKFLFKNWLIILPACKISEEKTLIVA